MIKAIKANQGVKKQQKQTSKQATNRRSYKIKRRIRSGKTKN
jgi:hypothetical protein